MKKEAVVRLNPKGKVYAYTPPKKSVWDYVVIGVMIAFLLAVFYVVTLIVLAIGIK